MTQYDIEMIEALRRVYPAGTRISLISMDDPYTTLKPGDEGVVAYIDDVANIHVNWDCGSTLALINGVDEFSVVVEDDTLTGKWRNEALPEGTIPDTVIEMIMDIRAEGQCNMMDSRAVQQRAHEKNYHTLVLYIEEHRREYASFITFGQKGFKS